MDAIYRILKEIKKRPGMYLGEKSITRLRNFLDGYLISKHDMDKNYNTSFYKFASFVGEYYDDSSNKGWNRIILENSEDEAKAVDIFYELIDKFIEKKYEKEIIYSYQTNEVIYDNFPVKAVHYTDHGNPNRFSNPHEHEIKCFPDKSYYFLKLFNEEDLKNNLLYKMGSSGYKFTSSEEIIYNLKRGGEIEFSHNNSKYSITHPDKVICLTHIDERGGEAIFYDIEELMKHRIHGKTLIELATLIMPYFRCF